MQSIGSYNNSAPPVATNATATVVPASAAFPLNPSPIMVSDRYRYKQSIWLGVIQVIIGVLCIIFNAVSLAFYDGSEINGVGFVGHGFWIGMLFVVTGILGISAGKSRNRCTITAFMTLCIISSTFTVILLSLGIGGSVSSSRQSERVCGYDYGYYYPAYYRPPCYAFQVVVAMESCLAIAGFIEACVAIWGAVICCQSGICCCTGPPQAVVLPVNFYPNNGQMMYFTSAQGVQMVYAPPPTAMSYHHGVVVPPLSYQTTFSQPTWTRPQQITVTSAAMEASAPGISDSPPPPYPTSSQPSLLQTDQVKY